MSWITRLSRQTQIYCSRKSSRYQHSNESRLPPQDSVTGKPPPKRPPPPRPVDSLSPQWKITSKDLGGGESSRAVIAINKRTKERVALKIVSTRNNISAKTEAAREIEVLQSISHPNIVKLIGFSIDDHYTHELLELLEGHSLMSTDTVNDQTDIKEIMKQLFHAVAYLHACGIIHCDLRPEHVMFKSKYKLCVKIIDFGLAKSVNPGEKITDFSCNISEFTAPEIVEHSPYDSPPCGLGVLLFLLLFGVTPSENFLLHQQFPSEVDEEAKDLISKLLTQDPNRMTAFEALHHTWLK